MAVDEAPRAGSRFNLDRADQEHMNEGLEALTTPEPVPSLRNLEANTIRPLMEIALQGLTPSSTSDSQTGTGTSRLSDLQERLQSSSRGATSHQEESSGEECDDRKPQKNTDGAYHSLNRVDWTAAKRARRDAFHDASWAEYLTQPRIPESAVHLIIGDSLVRVLTRIQAHWQVGVLSFSGAATPQMLTSLDMLEMAKMYTVTLMIETNDLSRGEQRKVLRLQEKMSCILEELRIYRDPAILTICSVPYNMMVDQNAREMNDRVRNLNEIVRQNQQRTVLPVRLLDVASMMEHSLPDDASSDGIHFDNPGGPEWLNGVFQRHINLLESDMLETGQFTFGPPPIPPFFAARPLSDRLGGRIDSRESCLAVDN